MDKPIFPDHDGRYSCECNDEFKDIFDFLEHNGVEYEWGVRLTRSLTFDMFTFLSTLNEAMLENKYQDVYEHIQSAALVLMNAGEGQIEEFMEEVAVHSEMDDIYKGIEKMLTEEGKKSDNN